MPTHYTLDHDTGIMTYVLTPAATDHWSVRSTQYFRKCVFKEYSDASPRWELFTVNVTIQEIAK
jgi:hypothetical protein